MGKEKTEKTRKGAESQGLNISDDALFIVSELRNLRGLFLLISGSMIGLIVGFGVAILSLL